MFSKSIEEREVVNHRFECWQFRISYDILNYIHMHVYVVHATLLSIVTGVSISAWSFGNWQKWRQNWMHRRSDGKTIVNSWTTWRKLFFALSFLDHLFNHCDQQRLLSSLLTWPSNWYCQNKPRSTPRKRHVLPAEFSWRKLWFASVWLTRTCMQLAEDRYQEYYDV